MRYFKVHLKAVGILLMGLVLSALVTFAIGVVMGKLNFEDL